MVLLHRFLFLATLLTVASLTKADSMPYLRQADLSKYLSESTPTNKAKNNGQWMSVSEDVEFMQNTNLPPLPRSPKIRKLETGEGDEEGEEEGEEEGSTTGAWEEHDPYSHLWRVCQNTMNINRHGDCWVS
jgi:hypothetical protein